MMHFGLGGFLILIPMLLFWLLVVGLGVWIVSRLFPRPTGGSTQTPTVLNGGTQSAIDILKQRYARGEINKAEYDEMRRTLQD